MSRPRRLPPRPTGTEVGDLTAGIDEAVFDLRALLEWADRDADVPDEPPEV